MRTTLTLDDDVAQLIERIRRRRGASLRDVVNDGLREGLPRLDAPARPRKPYRMKGVSLGDCLIPHLDNIAEVLAVAEGEDFR